MPLPPRRSSTGTGSRRPAPVENPPNPAGLRTRTRSAPACNGEHDDVRQLAEVVAGRVSHYRLDDQHARMRRRGKSHRVQDLPRLRVGPVMEYLHQDVGVRARQWIRNEVPRDQPQSGRCGFGDVRDHAVAQRYRPDELRYLSAPLRGLPWICARFTAMGRTPIARPPPVAPVLLRWSIAAVRRPAVSTEVSSHAGCDTHASYFPLRNFNAASYAALTCRDLRSASSLSSGSIRATRSGWYWRILRL